MIGIIQYGAGNIFSLTAALDRLGIEYGMISHESDFEQYNRYIIPGVGHAGAAMEKLESTGLVPTIRKLTKPVLGICVGMQLITSFSEEGNADLLNIVPVKTLRFQEEHNLKIPHTGWNQVHPKEMEDLFENIDQEAYFYFVHSYFIEYNNLYTLASTQYGVEFSAAIKKNNFYGVQFHPEKSGAAGETLLTNFAHL
ncbi:MAG: imidazole glycerol phosphate synthase subunit HisH [Janthinobacterium lividum]